MKILPLLLQNVQQTKPKRSVMFSATLDDKFYFFFKRGN